MLSVLACCSPYSTAAAEFADLVVKGEHIITLDEASPDVTAVVVKGDRIVALTQASEVTEWVGPNTDVIELQGNQTLMPGLIESHGHFVGLGETLKSLDLRQFESWEEIVDAVAAVAKETPEGRWIVGFGWHQSKWKRPPEPNDEGYPIHDSLSAAVPNHPVLLSHASGHAAFANAAAMKLARVTDSLADPDGGEIVRDENGHATGLFRERAEGLIESAYARQQQMFSQAEQQADFAQSVQLAVEECHRYGITSFHDAGSSVATVAQLRALSESGSLPVRMYVMIRDSNERLQKYLEETRVVGGANQFFTVRAIKKSIDGALGPHGAWLLSPYEDKPESRGLATLPVSEVQEAIDLAKQHDYQVCVHAIGGPGQSHRARSVRSVTFARPASPGSLSD